MASQDEWANDPYRRNPEAPVPKPGMGCGMKLLLILGGMTAISVLVCCGGLLYIRSQVNVDFREDAAGALAMQKELLEIEVPAAFQPKMAVNMNLWLAGFRAVMYESPAVAETPAETIADATAAEATAQPDTIQPDVNQADANQAESTVPAAEEVDPADEPAEKPAPDGTEQSPPAETPVEADPDAAVPGAAGPDATAASGSPAGAPARGTLMLAEITISIPGVPEQEFQEQFREGFRSQGKEHPGKDLDIISSETREFPVRGENAPFVFAKAKDAQGVLYRQVQGTYPGRKGRGLLLLQVPEQEWQEADVERMLRSIK